MNVKLTQREKLLLQDQQKHEKICVDKYQSYANKAEDPELSQLFNSYAQEEQQHLNTVTQILNGQSPSMSSQQSQQQNQTNTQSSVQSSISANSSSQSSQTASQNDNALCTDMLMTEKFVSGAYDTAIFEFTDPSVRQTLNHIQKEEQGHGEGLFQYMQSKGMYNPQ